MSSPRAAPLLRFALILTALALALMPPPPPLVERAYARGVYPALQAALTSLSNLVPVSVFDIVVTLLLVVVVAVWVRAVRAARRDRSAWPMARAGTSTAVLASAVYLWFLVAWGFNYARPPLDVRLDLREMQVTTEAVRALVDQAVGVVNETHRTAHTFGFPQAHVMPDAIAKALADVEREQGRPRPTVVSRPKRTLFSSFFRVAGVDGMLAPFTLETLVNAEVTPPERPFVIAHEWAHLSGHADEADASFIAWLVTTRADIASLYSGWLFVVNEAAAQLPAGDRADVLAALGPGPRADVEAIAARLATRVEVVQRASWQVYDRYLKAQGVDDGLRSYSRGIELIVRFGAR